MIRLYRPTVHQIVILDREVLEWTEALQLCGAALETLSGFLAGPIVDGLRAQLAQAQRRVPALDARYPVVRGGGLQPAVDDERLRLGYWAYQEGTALFLHTICLWDDEADAHLFARRLCPLARQLHPHPPAPGHLGTAYLLTAALPDGSSLTEEREKELVRAILGDTELAERLRRGRLPGVTFFVDPLDLLEEAPIREVLLFDDPEVEDTPAVGRLALVEWPLISLYRLRLRRLYLAQHRQGLAREMEARIAGLVEALRRSLGRASEHRGQRIPALLACPNLSRLQDALTAIGGPQYGLLEVLAGAEELLSSARLDLENLERATARLMSLQPKEGGRPASPREVEEVAETLMERLRRDIAQMDAELVPARQVAERAARAVDVMKTLADILEAGYERRLNWVIGLVGTALAVGQLVDERAARALYNLGLDRLLLRMGIPLGSGDRDPVILLIRGLAVFLSLLAVGALLRLFLRPRRG